MAAVKRGQVVASPIWLGRGRRPAFGWWHAPADGRARAGVLLCPPLGFDYLQSHSALRLLAQSLAEQGFCVIRFDYDGTGDSAGGPGEARLATWTATARDAIALLRGNGLTEICLVGMRFGALFAAMAADRDGEVDQVVLWDPCVSGRSFLAEQKAITSLSTQGRSLTRDDGAVEALGVLYEAPTVADIDTMSIEQRTRPLGRRVLALTRGDRPSSRPLHDETLARETLRHGEAVDQLDLMDRVAPYQRLPLRSIRQIVDWLSDGASSLMHSIRPPATHEQRIVGADAQGHLVMETPVTVPPVGLFGMLTEPYNRPAAEGAPLVLLLNAGTHHHVGPARAWVDLSRQWAASGLRSLRLDLSGLGDSPFRFQDDGPWACNKAESFDDVHDAVRWGCTDDTSNVVLLGLCSSAGQAIESGLRLRTRGVVALNPSISFLPPERKAGFPVDPRRQTILPKDAVAPTFREGGRFGQLRERWPNLAWRTRICLSPGRRSGKWLGELVRQGTDTLIICGDSEIRPIRQGLSALGLRRLRHSGLLRLEHVAELDHALSFASQRQEILGMITDHVLSRFHRVQEGPYHAAGDTASTLSRVPA